LGRVPLRTTLETVVSGTQITVAIARNWSEQVPG
jgi:hypothetical protein